MPYWEYAVQHAEEGTVIAAGCTEVEAIICAMDQSDAGTPVRMFRRQIGDWKPTMQSTYPRRIRDA